MPDRRRTKPRAGQDGGKAPATESQGPAEPQGPQAGGGSPPRAGRAKAPASQAQGPQAGGGSGGSPSRAGAAAGGPGGLPPGASSGKARKAKASAESADSVTAGGRVRPRASQPAKLSEVSPAPAAEGPAGLETRSRLDVRKTYKLFIGGAFPRSESGRSYPVLGPAGTLLAHAARASRKDARDAVVAARKAGPGWAGATAYNRGQVLYRVAELLQGREAQFAVEIVKNEGLSQREAARTVAEAIDRWVWYAGWPDKVAQVAGAANPVAGPYFNFSVPEPTGVVAVLAPGESGLLGLVSVLAPVIATGNTAVVVASEAAPLAAITLAEVLATSDVPGGVVNILTGRLAELAPVLAAHMDVNAIDLTGAPAGSRPELERLAAGNVKRVFATKEDWAAAPTPARMLAFLEIKTVWHPVGV
jgi:Aldehyde dehydrogenase family